MADKLFFGEMEKKKESKSSEKKESKTKMGDAVKKYHAEAKKKGGY